MRSHARFLPSVEAMEARKVPSAIYPDFSGPGAVVVLAEEYEGVEIPTRVLLPSVVNAQTPVEYVSRFPDHAAVAGFRV